MNEAEILSKTYTHKCNIERNIETDADGETRFHKSVLTYNLACAVSNYNKGFNTTQATTNEIKYDSKMFCSPLANIKAGDKVTVTFENGLIVIYKAGEPFFYYSHLEVPLLREGDA